MSASSELHLFCSATFIIGKHASGQVQLFEGKSRPDAFLFVCFFVVQMDFHNKSCLKKFFLEVRLCS